MQNINAEICAAAVGLSIVALWKDSKLPILCFSSSCINASISSGLFGESTSECDILILSLKEKSP